MKHVLAAALTIALISTGSPSFAMENGIRLKIEGARAVGAVRVGDIDNGESNCSGLLITPTWVLTAGHCPARCGMSAIVGSRRDDIVDRALIEGRIRHPNYREDIERDEDQWDVALVKLFTPLKRRIDGELTTDFRVPIISESAEWFEDGRAVVYGYGITRAAQFENGRLSDRDLADIGFLRLGQFKIGDVEGRLVKLERLDARLFGGDSGAAILVPGHGEGIVLSDYSVLGVVSFVRGSDALGLASSQFSGWAKNIIDGDHPPTLCPAPVANIVNGIW